MKNFVKLLGIIALVAAIGFTMIACDNGSSPTPTPTPTTDLSGTWVNSEMGVKLVLDNGNYTASSLNGVEMVKATYTNTASYITIRMTHFKISALGDGSTEFASEYGLSISEWYTPAQFKEAYIQYGVDQGEERAEAEAEFDYLFGDLGSSQRAPYTLSGNTLTITMGEEGESITYTKQ
jgi:hypothetical protein